MKGSAYTTSNKTEANRLALNLQCKLYINMKWITINISFTWNWIIIFPPFCIPAKFLFPCSCDLSHYMYPLIPLTYFYIPLFSQSLFKYLYSINSISSLTYISIIPFQHICTFCSLFSKYIFIVLLFFIPNILFHSPYL